MDSAVDSEKTDSWSLEYIYGEDVQKLEKGKYNDAKNLCVHGQIESSKKGNKECGKKFDDLFGRIMNSYSEKQKQVTKNHVEEVYTDIPEDIDGIIELTLIKGVGISMARKLNEYGIYTIEQVAEYKPEKLSLLKGFGRNTATKLIDNAKSFLKSENEIEKSEFLSIQDFAEKSPINDDLEKEDIEIPETTIPFRDIVYNVGIDDIQNFDRLNDDIELINQSEVGKIDNNLYLLEEGKELLKTLNL